MSYYAELLLNRCGPDSDTFCSLQLCSPVIDGTHVTKICSTGPRGNHNTDLQSCSFSSTYSSLHIVYSNCRNCPVDSNQGSNKKLLDYCYYFYFLVYWQGAERGHGVADRSADCSGGYCQHVLQWRSAPSLHQTSPLQPHPTPRASSLHGSFLDTPVTSALPSPQIPPMMSGKSFLVAMKVKPLWKTPSMSAVDSWCPHCACPMRFTLPLPTASFQRR